MGFIYKITNTINKKAYVGITVNADPLHRWISHKSNNRNGRGCPLLMKAFKKHGEDAFTFEVLIICFDEDVYKYEKEYIIKYNGMSPNGYNVAEGGKSGRNFLGKTHSEETKHKISVASKKYSSRPEVRERYRQTAIEFNKTHNISDLLKKSEKWKKALEEGRIGRKGSTRSDDIKAKISEGLKRYYTTQLTNDNPIRDHKKHSNSLRKANGRKVVQFSKENERIAAFDSIVEAFEKTGVSASSIRNNVLGYSKTAYGYIWKYAEEKLPKDNALQ